MNLTEAEEKARKWTDRWDCPELALSLAALLEEVAEEAGGNQAAAVRLGQFIGDKLDEAKVRQQERQRAERIVQEEKALKFPTEALTEQRKAGWDAACDEILRRLKATEEKTDG
jgi:hypothetical protein